MQNNFFLQDTVVTEVPVTRTVAVPLYAEAGWQINQHEFSMQVEGVGQFYACNGREVEYTPAPGASGELVELYLNGSVKGAVLHQRSVLPLHGSSFAWHGQGVIVCGDSGSGKSSVTAAFVATGAEFLTDDITPVIFSEGTPCILCHSNVLKISEEMLQHLGWDHLERHPVSSGACKYKLSLPCKAEANIPVSTIFVLIASNHEEIEWTEAVGVDAFTALRNEVYRWQFLAAMPETEVNYLEQLLLIARSCRVIRVSRPDTVSIHSMKMQMQSLI